MTVKCSSLRGLSWKQEFGFCRTVPSQKPKKRYYSAKSVTAQIVHVLFEIKVNARNL